MSLEVPKLNVPGWEPRLEAFLKEAKSLLVSLQKDAGLGSSGSTDDGPIDTSLPFAPINESSATVLADQGTGTENAWTTIASGAPAGARWAKIQFEINSDDYADDVKMFYRTESGSQEIKMLDITPGGDVEMDHRDPIAWDFVQITGAGNFDYKVDTVSTPNWSITRIGYVI